MCETITKVDELVGGLDAAGQDTFSRVVELLTIDDSAIPAVQAWCEGAE